MNDQIVRTQFTERDQKNYPEIYNEKYIEAGELPSWVYTDQEDRPPVIGGGGIGCFAYLRQTPVSGSTTHFNYVWITLEEAKKCLLMKKV